MPHPIGLPHKAHRAKGIVPSPGYVIFNQVDVNKSRTLSRSEMERLVKSLMHVFKGQGIESMDKIMNVMDSDKSGDVDEQDSEYFFLRCFFPSLGWLIRCLAS